ncbi:MAG: gliding motility-associated C-terminal domain-containing protein [Elusimicrobia bacterium]|nr:gliding motility-associated C-terminal domain-containing protein [Elusimicrobiota bacterium]
MKVLRGSLWATLGVLLSLGAVPGRAALTEDLNLTININDTFAPDAVLDLAALATIVPGEVILTWTAPEDNGWLFTTTAPVNSYTVKYATFSISSEMAGGGSTTTWWNKALTAGSPPSIPADPGNAETMQANLTPGTSYWFALESVDLKGNSSPIDTKAATPVLQAFVYTKSLGDTKPPAPVAGFVVTRTTPGYTITWPAVTQNEDGTPIMDLASYEVYRSPSLFDFAASSTVFASVPMAGPLSVDIPTPAADTYFLIVAVDTTGRTSAIARSNFLHVTPQRFLGQTGTAQNGTYSRAFVPEGLIPELKTSQKNFLLCVEPETSSLANAGGSRTRATYTLCLREPNGVPAPKEMVLSRPQMTVVLNYQGGNGGLDKNKMGVLWWNGATWVKVAQANVEERGVGAGDLTVSFNTAVQGVYQIRQFDVATELTLDKAAVFPQIFSPNGDGINDLIYFVIQNPKQSSVSGRIIDMGGAEVGVLRPAGSGAPTEDTLTWDGRDSSGQSVPPGVYIYQIKGEGKTITGTMVIAR